MRSLSDNLVATQKLPPLINYVNGAGHPAVKVELYRKRGSTNLFEWARYAQFAFESFSCTTDFSRGTSSASWSAQTFTPRYPFSLDTITLNLRRFGSPGNGTLSIKATDGSGHPTGDDLTSVTVNGNSITDANNTTWYSYTLTPFSLTIGTQYAIVLRFPSGDANNYVFWFGTYTAATYPRGMVEYSNNSGVTWYSWTNADFNFSVSDSSFYDCEEPSYIDTCHAATIPSDGSLLRMFALPDTHYVYYQRITSPDSASDFHSWESLGVLADSLALASYGASVWCFRANGTDPFIHVRESHDCGATWGEWQQIGSYLGSKPYYLAACAKSETQCLVLLALEDTIYRSRGTLASYDWLSPSAYNDPSGNWSDEPNSYDDDIETYASHSSVTEGEWSDFLEFTSINQPVNSVRVYASAPDATILACDIDGYYSGSWHDLKEALLLESQWNEYQFSTLEVCEKLRIRITPNITSVIQLHEFAFRASTKFESFTEWTKSLASITGVACTYLGDWNVVVTGVDSSARDGVWSCIFGDGYSAAVATWTSLKELLVLDSTSDYEYYCPCLGRPDTIRTFFVEKYTASIAQQSIAWSHSPPTKDFIDNLWLEPVPFPYSINNGLCLSYSATGVWLTTPTSVWYSDISVPVYDVSSDVLEIRFSEKPLLNRSKMTIVLDNTSNKYATFTKLGWEVRAYLGYNVGGSYEYSQLPSTWITSYKFVSPPWFPLRSFWPSGIIGTLQIETEGFWELLSRWRPRRDLSWEADDKNIFQLLTFIFSRIGVEFSSISSSTACTSFEPEFEIPAGYTGKWAVVRLLSWIEDVLFQRQDVVYLKWPLGNESSVYSFHSLYGGNHILFRGSYGTALLDPNRVQVWGDSVMSEGKDCDEIARGYDRLKRVTTPDYPSSTRAAERVERELRRGQIKGGSPGWVQVPWNCAQELWDVITLTDFVTGVNAVKYRVTSIVTTYNKKYRTFYQVYGLGRV